MGKRRSADEWQQLFVDFEASSETVAAFCAPRGLSAMYFGKKYRSHKSSFVGVSIKSASKPVAHPVTLQIGDVFVRCDSNTPTHWLADLAAALR